MTLRAGRVVELPKVTWIGNNKMELWNKIQFQTYCCVIELSFDQNDYTKKSLQVNPRQDHDAYRFPTANSNSVGCLPKEQMMSVPIFYLTNSARDRCICELHFTLMVNTPSKANGTQIFWSFSSPLSLSGSLQWWCGNKLIPCTKFEWLC